MESDRFYRHFCMMARALEVVGERWSLPVVRDLLLGPRRFTDLARSLGGITPTRLTKRLRWLEAAGIVVRERAAGREVWYRLTESGLDLGPVVEAFTLWGIEHAREGPRAGEPVTPVPVMIGSKVWLSRNAPEPAKPVDWVWRFPAGESYTLRFDEGGFTLSRGEAEAADVIVEATPEAWARLLTAPRGARHVRRKEIRLRGKARAIRDFANAFAIVVGSA
jgi:DNA-binding HxlR family transcriptional regulator